MKSTEFSDLTWDSLSQSMHCHW